MNSSNSSQHLNESGKSTSSTEHHQQTNLIGELREEDESPEIEEDEDRNGRCRVM